MESSDALHCCRESLPHRTTTRSVHCPHRSITPSPASTGSDVSSFVAASSPSTAIKARSVMFSGLPLIHEPSSLRLQASSSPLASLAVLWQFACACRSPLASHPSFLCATVLSNGLRIYKRKKPTSLAAVSHLHAFVQRFSAPMSCSASCSFACYACCFLALSSMVAVY